MTAATNVSPRVAKLLPSVRTRTTAQLIREHAMAEKMTGGDASDVAAWILVLSAIETVLEERDIPTCPDCGTPSDTHADYCRNHKA